MLKLFVRFFMAFSATLIMSGVLCAQTYPKYCKTDAGVLGPYPNNSVKVGEACYGTKNGKRYDGVAVMSKSGDDDTEDSSKGDSDSDTSKSSYPKYCKTDAGVLGPYPNNSVKVGEACYGTKNGKRYDGVAVMSKSGD